MGFDTEAMPIGVTVVAEQQDYRLMPIREEGQPVYILLDEQLEPEEVLGYVEKKMGLRLQWWRFLCGVFVFVGMLCRFDDGRNDEVEHAACAAVAELCRAVSHGGDAGNPGVSLRIQ